MHRALLLSLLTACGSKAPNVPIDAPPLDGPPLDAPPGSISVNLLSFNDFHGALDPTNAMGGAAYLAAKIASLRTPNTIVIEAGDVIGASPLVSGLFHDEPTIDIMNAIGLDYAGVGNHEFDEGDAELHRMQNGGCHPTDGCAPGTTFTGATFKYLAANVVDSTTGQTIFPSYDIREIGGVKIAIVGMTLMGTPATTLASAIPELVFGDEVETMAALVPEIHAAGANIVVLALHQGASSAVAPDECLGATGPVMDLAMRMDPAVVMIAAGHIHSTFNCTVGGKLVTSAGANGLFVTQTTLVIDPATQSVFSATAHNLAVTDDITPDPTVAAIVAQYHQLAAPVGDRVIGTITADLAGGSTAGELLMGDVIADAMLDATAPPHATAAQIALMNTGGIRGTLLFAKSGAETVDGEVTYAEAFSVQPFSNLVQTVDVTGADLVAALDFMQYQVAGMSYTYHPGAAAGSHVTAADVMIGGVPLDPLQTYRATVNSIVAGMPGFETATNIVGDGVDLDLLAAYFGAHSPISPPDLDRIFLGL